MSDVIKKPLPPTWNGQKWSWQLLHQKMSVADLKKAIALYGIDQINAACKRTAAGGTQ